MTSRYRIQHTSLYEYDRSVVASVNEARLTPLRTAWQTPLESTLSVDPSTWHCRYTDYWGTEVRVFEANGTHRTLQVRSTSLVEVDASRRPESSPMDWADLRDHAVRDDLIEYLAQTPMTEPSDDLRDLASSIAADNAPDAAARAISDTVHDALSYLPGSTEVRTTAKESWESRSGVCQDYAHLAVGALRHVGLPARYVSGYLHPAADPLIGDTAQGESHAWVEWWLGEWVAYDPTNAVGVAERHIMVGAGRDYSDQGHPRRPAPHQQPLGHGRSDAPGVARERRTVPRPSGDQFALRRAAGRSRAP